MDLVPPKREDYVLRSAVCLAKAWTSAEPTGLCEVSQDAGVPVSLVPQIMADLVHSGIAVSGSGHDGGYRLARPPGQITLLEVAEAALGPHRGGPWPVQPSPVQKTLVAAEDRGGHSASLADSLGARLGARGAEVKVLPLSRVGRAELSWASAMVVCTWVEGFVVARVGPARATRAWLESLPPLGGMPVAVLCSYAISPARTLHSVHDAVERRGGTVVAERAFAPHQRSEALDDIALALLRNWVHPSQTVAADPFDYHAAGDEAGARPASAPDGRHSIDPRWPPPTLGPPPRRSCDPPKRSRGRKPDRSS